MFQRYLYVIFSLWSLVSAEVYLYDTHSVQDYPRLKFNCIPATYEASYTEIIAAEYCLRPSNNDNSVDWWSEGIPSATDQKYTFDQLVQLNLTAKQLLSWSISVALVEEYQYYLNHRDSRLASTEVFRCVAPWFGSRCQYSLDLPEDDDFSTRIEEFFVRRFFVKQPDYMTYLNCYTLLHCTEDGTAVCLHWSQVCDGKIDCVDGEEDEKSCFIMEINECKPNEYRCHNGQCIPDNGYREDTLACLDLSNKMDQLSSEPLGAR